MFSYVLSKLKDIYYNHEKLPDSMKKMRVLRENIQYFLFEK